MRFVADTHLHIYPCYDVGLALRSLAANLAKTGPADGFGGILAERGDCRWLRDTWRRSPAEPQRGIRMTAGREPGCIEVRIEEGPPLFIFAGRQVATSERIEVLVLLGDLDIADGTSAAETVERALEAEAVPVLTWAFGKWFGERGRLAQNLFQRYRARGLMLADSSLRARFFPAPSLFRAARRAGVPVLAGTDPLPFRGEERRIGNYASALDVVLDPQRPVRSLRMALAARGTVVRSVGRRCAPLAAAWRLASAIAAGRRGS